MSPLASNLVSSTGPQLPVTPILICTQRHTQRYEIHIHMQEQKRAAQPPTTARNDALLNNGRLLLCTSPSCFVFVSIYFPVNVPLHNIIYCRKLSINWLLKLSERKTEAIVLSVRVQMENFVFPLPPKKMSLHSLWKIVLQEIISL